MLSLLPFPPLVLVRERSCAPGTVLQNRPRINYLLLSVPRHQPTLQSSLCKTHSVAKRERC